MAAPVIVDGRTIHIELKPWKTAGHNPPSFVCGSSAAVKKPRDEQGHCCADIARDMTYRFVGVILASKSPNGL